LQRRDHLIEDIDAFGDETVASMAQSMVKSKIDNRR
jgi:hypothetical protein